jgi:hypothetical protein
MSLNLCLARLGHHLTFEVAIESQEQTGEQPVASGVGKRRTRAKGPRRAFRAELTTRCTRSGIQVSGGPTVFGSKWKEVAYGCSGFGD